MWWFLQSVIISIAIIAILHYGWDYIKTTYSTHKTKDMVKIQSEKYDTILSELLKTKSSPEIQLSPEEMENDLAMFLEQTLSDYAHVSTPSPPQAI